MRLEDTSKNMHWLHFFGPPSRWQKILRKTETPLEWR